MRIDSDGQVKIRPKALFPCSAPAEPRTKPPLVSPPRPARGTLPPSASPLLSSPAGTASISRPLRTIPWVAGGCRPVVRSAILSAIRSAAPLRTDTPSRHRCRSAPRVTRLGGQTSSTAVDASDDRGRPGHPNPHGIPSVLSLLSVFQGSPVLPCPDRPSLQCLRPAYRRCPAPSRPAPSRGGLTGRLVIARRASCAPTRVARGTARHAARTRDHASPGTPRRTSRKVIDRSPVRDPEAVGPGYDAFAADPRKES